MGVREGRRVEEESLGSIEWAVVFRTRYFIQHLRNLHRVSVSELDRPPPLRCLLLKLLDNHLFFRLCLWPGVVFLKPETMSCSYWHAQDLAWGDASWVFGEWVSACKRSFNLILTTSPWVVFHARIAFEETGTKIMKLVMEESDGGTPPPRCKCDSYVPICLCFEG